jgi:hypothetical protein
MIFSYLIKFVLSILFAFLDWLPDVKTFPTIGGFDIDGALVTGLGYVRTFTQTFWLFDYVLVAFLSLMGYYIVKMVVRLVLGSRAPG